MKHGIYAFAVIAVLSILTFSVSLSGQVFLWKKQLDADPTNTELLLKLGKANHDLGCEKEDKEAVKKAEKYLSKLFKIGPNNALALAKDEHFKEAEVKFAKVTAINSDSEFAKNARQQLKKMQK